MMTSETVTVVNVPQQHSQHPSSQTSGPKVDNNLSWITFNVSYFKTVPGILKLVQLLFGIIIMSTASPALLGATHFFLFVAVTSFIATILWSFVYFLGIRDVLNLPINWILSELVNISIATILYFIGFIVQLAAWSGRSGYFVGSNITAGVFGIFNTLAYAAGSYFLYIEHKNSVATL